MRRFILILCCLTLTACTNNQNHQLDLYNRLVDKVNDQNQVTDKSVLPFDIEVYFEKVIDEEITYRVIIDNPKEPIKNIKAVAVHNYKTKDIYPTSGVFEEPLNLIPNNIDLKDNNAKGIILIGYIDYTDSLDDFDGVVKVLITYDDNDGNNHEIYYEYHK
jgi:hypothetical protein